MIQILIQGLLLSGLYALIAIGFTMIFSVGRVLNLAYGVNLMLGGYAYFWVSQSMGMPKIIGVAAGAAIGILFGMMIHRLIVKPLKSDPVPVEIATLILAVVTQAGVILIFGDASKILLPIVEGNWQVAGVSVTANRLSAAVISWLVLIGLFFFVRKTHVGRAISAVSMDVKGAALSGINPDRINTITWGLSGALGGLAGVFFASVTQLYPAMWVAPLIIAVAVVIVGGIGSIWGTLVVAHIIGFMEVISASFMPEIRGIMTMALIIGVLVMMPKGLFGRGEL